MFGLGSVVCLVVLLSLQSSGHLDLPPVVALSGTPLELICESTWVHLLFDAINDADDVVDIALKLLAFLQAVHGDQVSFLFLQGVQIALFLWLLWRF